MFPGRLGNDLAQPGQQFDLAQHHPGARRPGAHQCDIAAWDQPGTVPAPVGSAPVDRRRQHHVEFAGRLTNHLDGGQMVDVRRVRQPSNAGVPAQRGQSDGAVVQG